MFDVTWVDPTAETVGQRRRRKEREGDGASGRRGSIKTTSSGASSQGNNNTRTRSKSSGTGWGLFGGSKKSKEVKEIQPREIESSHGRRTKTPNSDLMTSALSTKTSEFDRERELERELLTRMELREQEMISRMESREREYIETPTTPVESVFSLPTERSNRTESSWGGSVSEASSRHYYRGRSDIRKFSPPAPPSEYLHEDRPTFYDDPDHLGDLMSEMTMSYKDDDRDFTIHEDRHISRSGSRLGGYHKSERHQFPRAPSTSRSQSQREGPSGALPRVPLQAPRPPKNRALPEPPKPENSAIRLRVRKMEAASAKIILQRLVEEWDEDEDEAIYNELQFEKQLWMAIGLRHLRMQADSKQPQRLNGALEPSKVLSLYESTVFANILSTMHPIGSKTHHLTTSAPSSIEQTNHLHTLIVATPTIVLPYAQSTFSTITSIRLPMLLPSSSIPAMLGECHRILNTNGTLQLTIMDPTPVSSTLGPKLRTWMEDHLLLKMETQFRCLKPAKLLPIWLESAGFNISPAVKVVESTQPVPLRIGFSFRAIGRGEGGYRLPTKDKASETSDMLASTVGRMLWKEIYGPFVTGRRWWWEDEEIVEEAYALGTKWDVAVVEAVKKAEV